MDLSELEKIQNESTSQIFWVRFKAKPDEEYLLYTDYLLFNFVHQKKLEFYYEASFTCDLNLILSLRPSDIAESDVKLVGFDNQEHLKRTFADPDFRPQFDSA